MMSIISLISEWVGLILNIQTLVGSLIGIAIYRCLSARKKYHLRKVLSLDSSKKCFASIPYFIGTVGSYERDVALCEELQLLVEVNAMLAGAGIEIETRFNDTDIGCGEIHIGGPAANEYTNRHFNYYLKNIRYMSPHERTNTNKKHRRLNFDFTDIIENTTAGWKIGDTLFPYVHNKRDCAVLIKLIDKSDVPYKTIHMLFGAGTIGTVGAVNYFTRHYSSIYRINRSRPYIGVFEVNDKGEKVSPVRWLDTRDFLK